MTITCSHCGCPFVPDADRTVVACALCGHRTFNPYARLDDDDDDWEYENDDVRAYETACVDCGAPGIDCCQCCGGYLCGMHGEIGAGFCRNCPTQEWIDEQDAGLADVERAR